MEMQRKRVSHRHLPESLTSDTRVISSMKAIQRAGFWMLIVGVLSVSSVIAAMILLPSRAGEIAPFLLLTSLLFIYDFVLAIALNNLKGTTAATIFILVINIIICLFLAVGILPLVSLITSLIALIKIGPYAHWRKTASDPAPTPAPSSGATSKVQLASQGPMRKLRNEADWRRLVVIYWLVGGAVTALVLIVIVVLDQQTSCSTSPLINNGRVFCGSAVEMGNGIGYGWILVPIILTGLGYVFLPKIYKYLHPKHGDE